MLTLATTASVYAWNNEVLQKVDIKAIKGMFIDFRTVKKFDFKNLQTASKESRGLNQKFDLSALPVAVLVKNMYQEQMVSISMKLTAQTQRMRMVYTEAEALQFLHDWHQAHPAPDASFSSESTIEG